MKIDITLKGREATMEEAINAFSGGETMLLANLIEKLIEKDMLKPNELEEIFEWEIGAEEEIKF